MILEIVLIGFFLGVLFLWLGLKKESFPFSYLSMFIFLMLGLMLLQSGLDIATGSTSVFNETTMTNVTTTDYTNYSTNNNAIVGIISNFLFYGSFVGIILTTIVSVRVHEDW